MSGEPWNRSFPAAFADDATLSLTLLSLRCARWRRRMAKPPPSPLHGGAAPARGKEACRAEDVGRRLREATKVARAGTVGAGRAWPGAGPVSPCTDARLSRTREPGAPGPTSDAELRASPSTRRTPRRP